MASLLILKEIKLADYAKFTPPPNAYSLVIILFKNPIHKNIKMTYFIN